MMGTVEALKEPTTKTKFVEDMTLKELNAAQNIPSGLSNLGNTCYLNATLQCLKAMPELSDLLKSCTLGYDNDNQKNLLLSLRDTFKMVDKCAGEVTPLMLLGYLRSVNPQFAQQSNQGFYMQQDAEECWSFLMETLRSSMKHLNVDNFIEKFMVGEMISVTKCDDVPEEEATFSSSSFIKLNCHISSEISQVASGLERGLIESFEKNSSTGRLARYTKTSKLNSLPVYLPINFIRFFWKQSEQIKAKILKKVQFPLILDVYPFCSQELQSKLLPAREAFRKFDDAKDVSAQTLSDEEIKEFGEYPLSGYYDLVAVLTHVGRSADSGHYIGWSKKGNDWWKFDDEKVTKVSSDDILKLDGGGDWHAAYMLLYRERQLKSAK